MKYFLCTFFLTVVIPAIVFSAEPDKKLHEMGLYPTVKLSFRICDCSFCRANPETNKSVGSGVIVRSEKSDGPIFKGKYLNVVLTAAHNVEHAKPPIKIVVFKYKNWSEIDGFDEFTCTTYEKNKDLDIAVMLFVSEKQMSVAKLNVDKKIYLGDKIIKFGFGLGDDIRFDEGKITSVKTLIPAVMAEKVRINAHTIFGDSGGPVYDDEYSVIGITNAIRTNGNYLHTQQSYFVSTNDIKTWNESINNNIGFVYKVSDKLPNATLFNLWLLDYQIIGDKK
jgi:S1-C subfamily serine protease